MAKKSVRRKRLLELMDWLEPMRDLWDIVIEDWEMRELVGYKNFFGFKNKQKYYRYTNTRLLYLALQICSEELRDEVNHILLEEFSASGGFIGTRWEECAE